MYCISQICAVIYQTGNDQYLTRELQTLLTNLTAVGRMINTWYKRKLKGLELHRGRKSKNSKCVGTWINAISSISKIRHAPRLHDHVTDHVTGIMLV